MNTAPHLAKRIVDGRTVVDELPRRVGVLPGEVELVAQHLHGVLREMLGDRSGGAKPPHPQSQHATRQIREGGA